MKSSGTYSVNLGIQIDNLALSLYQREICRAEMEKEDFSAIVMKQTRDGEQPVENPVFKVLARVQADITRQMKQLKLTVADIVGVPEQEDAIDRLNAELDAI